jgi:hypothetical protein
MESFVKYLDPIKQPKSLVKTVPSYQLYLCWRWVEGRNDSIHEDDAFFFECRDVEAYWRSIKRKRESTPVENDRRVIPRTQEPSAAEDNHLIKDEPSSPENDITEDESCGECQSPASITISGPNPLPENDNNEGDIFEAELRAFGQLVAKRDQAPVTEQNITAPQSTNLQHQEEHSNPALDATAPFANTRKRHGIVRRKVHF